MKNVLALLFISLCHSSIIIAQRQQAVIVPVAKAWAHNSVNVTVFRKNSLVTDGNTQFVAFYNEQQYVVLGKRKTGAGKWLLKQTDFKGNASDAHNIISIMVDGNGYLHLAWNHHNSPLHYSKSITPESLEMTDELPMTGLNETHVSYPEFYKLPSGNLLFLYRAGGSGNGNLIINQYNIQTKKWKQIQSNLIDGEGQRNAYWQAYVDVSGRFHLSWVWRETPDVATNHDMCYAYSDDEGMTWKKSTGKKYQLPINALTAEYVCRIPQKSELINQTSMYANENGNVFIATYWRDEKDSVPQYHIICKINNQWKTINTAFRKTPFSLSGTGTKKILVARPQIISWNENNKPVMAIIYRDEEQGNGVLLALNKNIEKNKWQLINLWKEDAGSWEPTYDTELWKNKKQLNLFVLKAIQVDGEGKADTPPQMVSVLEWKPLPQRFCVNYQKIF